MTIDELEALPLGMKIFLPTDWDVQAWLWAGKVHDRNFYTLLHPPDQNGVIRNRWPYFIDGVQLLKATLDEQTAWLHVIAGLAEHTEWIYKVKLPQTNGPESTPENLPA